jgi:hypothetical protein
MERITENAKYTICTNRMYQKMSIYLSEDSEHRHDVWGIPSSETYKCSDYIYLLDVWCGNATEITDKNIINKLINCEEYFHDLIVLNKAFMDSKSDNPGDDRSELLGEMGRIRAKLENDYHDFSDMDEYDGEDEDNEAA